MCGSRRINLYLQEMAVSRKLAHGALTLPLTAPMLKQKIASFVVEQMQSVLNAAVANPLASTGHFIQTLMWSDIERSVEALIAPARRPPSPEPTADAYAQLSDEEQRVTDLVIARIVESLLLPLQ